MIAPSGSLESLRARNRLAVLQAAQQRRTVTRTQIARITGLSTTTVSSLVGELVDDRVLVETADRVAATVGGSAGGRPAVALALNPGVGAVVGIHLGHADVKVVVAGLDGEVRAERATDFDVDHEPAETLEYVASTALDLVADLDLAHRDVLGVGVAASAPVLLSSHALSSPPMLRDWSDVDIAALLKTRMGLPVYVANDANLGALAEWRLGAGTAVDDLVYVMLSEGVGSGLLLHGRLYEGATGASGELGHVTVVPDGHICRCGNRGCLETVVGARALLQALAHTRGPGGTLEELLGLAATGDAGARRLLGDAGRAVGHALAGVCTMLDPRLVVVGGPLARAGDVLLDGIRDVLARTLPPVTNQGIRVVPAALGDRAEVLGAATLAGRGAATHLAELARRG